MASVGVGAALGMVDVAVNSAGLLLYSLMSALGSEARPIALKFSRTDAFLSHTGSSTDLGEGNWKLISMQL